MKEKNVMAFENLPVVKINASPALIYHLLPLFQTGFLFQCQIGLSIEDFLLRQLALSMETVEKRISTIFLDGQCVDNIVTAILNDHSIVALSSALPGLAGATLRRGGFYAGLRDSITYHNEDTHTNPRKGIITVKLFNLLIEELGPIFLRKGIIIDSPTIVDLFHDRGDLFWKGINTVFFEDRHIDYTRELSKDIMHGNTDYVIIRIDIENKP